MTIFDPLRYSCYHLSRTVAANNSPPLNIQQPDLYDTEANDFAVAVGPAVVPKLPGKAGLLDARFPVSVEAGRQLVMGVA